MANKVSVDLDMNVQGYVQGIDQASQSTEKYETDLRKIKDSTGNFRKEFAAAKKEVLNLAQAYNKLDSEAKKSAFGQEMARQLNEAKEKAAEMTDMMGDINQELKNMASDTHTLDMFAESIGFIGDAAAGTMGAIASFTGEEEDAQRAVVAFTTAQSALGAVTKMQNALQMQSNTMMAVSKVQTLAATTATNLKTAAEGKGVIVTKAATVAQAAFNKIAMANPYVLLATAILTVVSALGAFIAFTHKAADEEEAEQRIAEKSKSVHEAYYKALNSSLEETIPNYIKLQTEWQNLRTEGEKTQWIKDNQDEFNKLGIEINNVDDAENALIQNSDSVMKAFMQRAQAAAMAARATEVYKQMLEDVQWLEEHRNDNSITDSELESHGSNRQSSGAKYHHSGGALGLGRDRMTINADEAIANRRKKANEEIEKLYKDMGRTQQNSEKTLADAGVKAITKGNKKKDAARKAGGKETKKIIHENSLEQAEEEVKTWDQALKQADINDTELINKIKENLKKAQDKVQGIKIKLGIEIDKEQAKKQAEALNLKTKLETEGVTKTGSADFAKAITGTYEHTIKGVQDAISAVQKKLTEGNDWGELPTEQYEKYANILVGLRQELEGLQKVYESSLLTPMEKAVKMFDETMEKAEQTADTFASFGSIANSVGSAFKSMGDDTTAAIMQTIGAMLEMTAQILPQITALIAAKQAEAMASGTASAAKLPYPANLGAIASIVATILSTFASIWSALESHADGGIVGGGSYSGDKVLARLNSGEMVLNQRQQRNLFSLLDNGLMPQKGGTNVQVTGVIRGTDIMLVQKNTNKVLSKTGNKINF